MKENDGRTAFGLSGFKSENLDKIIDFLESYIGGEPMDLSVKPLETSIANFIRYCVDDIKAYYYESMIAQRKDDEDSKIHEWFWSDTAAGALVMRLAEKMKEDENEEINGMSFGIAR